MKGSWSPDHHDRCSKLATGREDQIHQLRDTFHVIVSIDTFHIIVPCDTFLFDEHPK
jgi:hypothetical protein